MKTVVPRLCFAHCLEVMNKEEREWRLPNAFHLTGYNLFKYAFWKYIAFHNHTCSAWHAVELSCRVAVVKAEAECHNGHVISGLTTRK